MTNLGSGGTTYNAALINNALISTSDKVVGTGSLQLSAASSQYVTIPTFDSGGSGLSFAFWFKFINSASSSRIFDFGNGPNQYNVGFALVTTGGPDIYLITGSSNAVEAYGSQGYLNVNDGVWRHAVMTFDTSGNLILYINGQIYCVYTTATYPPGAFRSSNFLGKSNFNIDPYLNGAVDEFYLWDGVITPAEAKAIYLPGKILCHIASDDSLSYSMHINSANAVVRKHTCGHASIS